MNLNDTIFDWAPNKMLQVSLPDPDAFLKIKETLTRIGIASRPTDDGQKRKLYQSAHILHKKGNYYITHFKELFILDGRDSTLTTNDIARRNTIASLLEQWGLLKIVDQTLAEPKAPLSQVKVISFADKQNWDLVAKYSIGKDKYVPVD